MHRFADLDGDTAVTSASEAVDGHLSFHNSLCFRQFMWPGRVWVGAAVGTPRGYTTVNERMVIGPPLSYTSGYAIATRRSSRQHGGLGGVCKYYRSYKYSSQLNHFNIPEHAVDGAIDPVADPGASEGGDCPSASDTLK